MTKKTPKTGKKRGKKSSLIDIPPEVADMVLDDLKTQKELSTDKFPSQFQIIASYINCDDEDAKRVYPLLSILLLARQKFGKGGDVLNLGWNTQATFIGNQATVWMDNYCVTITSLINSFGEVSGVLEATITEDKKKVTDRKKAANIMGYIEHVLSKLPHD